MRRPYTRGPLKERLRARLKKMPSGCWEWQGARTPAGYGKLNVDGRYIGTHVIAYELKNGPVPTGCFVLHKCDNPPCARDSHLFAGTPRENTHDAMRKGRPIGRPRAGG